MLPPGAVTLLADQGLAADDQVARRQAGAKLIMGVNLAGGRPALAAAEARAFMEGIGTRYIDALEIGNEPDLYNASSGTATAAAASSSPAPPATASPTICTEFSRWRQVLPPVPLAGPALASLTWLTTGLDSSSPPSPGRR